jgi:transglycosylase-like protein with SLT domain
VGNGSATEPSANKGADSDESNTATSSSGSETAQPTLAEVDSSVATTRKPYRDMNDKERMDFIDRHSRIITMRISNSSHPEVFDEFVIRKIKNEVDQYVPERGGADLRSSALRSVFERAAQYAPYISRCFNQEAVPPVVGLYIVWIETGFRNYNHENSARAMGLFQFIPETAREYGVSDPAERANVEKMGPAAARYMRDRISRFGGDAKGVALAIANYNRGGTPQDLRTIIDAKNPDRSFWTLMANKEKLNRFFQAENVHYVPKFFAAAIIGENPLDFGLAAKPLSAL